MVFRGALYINAFPAIKPPEPSDPFQKPWFPRLISSKSIKSVRIFSFSQEELKAISKARIINNFGFMRINYKYVIVYQNILSANQRMVIACPAPVGEPPLSNPFVDDSVGFIFKRSYGTIIVANKEKACWGYVTNKR